MSWAAHDPELWVRIQATGIANKLAARLAFTTADIVERLTNLEDSNDLTDYAIWQALTDWASDEIAAAEGDHFADAADAAHESEIDRIIDQQEGEDFARDTELHNLTPEQEG